MFKSILASLCLLTLAACATTGGVPSSGDISDRVKQIQSLTATFCKFVPTVGTIANILSGGAASSVTAIATDICNAVTTAPLADGGRRAAYVNGVRVRGSFVR